MKAVILCGGRGTRIREVSEFLPKPMLTVGGRPLLWHIMKIYDHYGIKDFILSLGYKGWAIKEFFLNYQAKIFDITVNLGKENSIIYHKNHEHKLDWNVSLVETGEESQTGSRIWNARKYLEDSDMFCLTYGDSVGDIDIKSLIQTHKKSGLLGTITGVHPSGRFGEIETDGKVISSFAEKPNVSFGLYNGGFMIFNKKVLDKYFRPGKDLILEAETLPRMVKDGQLGLYEHKGFWQCVDTARELESLENLWNSPNPPWKVW
ncbi:MAG: glucose-1-phosphate cytidylyltransferase [Candidatus Omnitrophica bacterium]|nr:glucose-1-phosphate cytidylyltransferase [Candidatus Omnitrophota bacterium]MBU2251194.1 glucose-1-phosphate cytidylyltransferase [Candidatus Omnitrophota bacterium]